MNCRKTGCSRANNAGLLLMWIRYLLDDDFPKSMEILNDLNAKYQTSILIQITTAFLLSLEGKVDDSLHWYDKTIASADQVRFAQIATGYLKGDVYWNLGKWRECVKITEIYLNESNSPYFKCFGHFRLAFSYWMLGEKEKVTPLLEKVTSLAKQNYEHDAVCSSRKKKKRERSD
jgi:tetratricopeptide (TPR) repeat protein